MGSPRHCGTSRRRDPTKPRAIRSDRESEAREESQGSRGEGRTGGREPRQAWGPQGIAGRHEGAIRQSRARSDRIVNLKRAKKAKDRAAKEERAAENRAKHGVPKALRDVTKARSDKAARDPIGS